MQSIFSIIGLLLGGLAIIMLIPPIADMNHSGPFFLASGITGFIASVLYLSGRQEKYSISAHEAYLLTTGAWITLAIFAALPFAFTGMTVTNAAFETVSGLTTTGSTVLSGLDTMSPAILLWRALLQWIGGVGIVVTSIAILPLLRVGGMQLFKTESSDQTETELPRATKLAAATLWVYAGLSLSCFLAYWIAGMSSFDALTHAMTTISTGGYSTHDASMGFFEGSTIKWIAASFMLASGMPLVMYIQFFSRGSVAGFQAKSLLLFVGIVIVVLTFWVMGHSNLSIFDAITMSTFNVISIATTTGFAINDYTLWGTFAVALFFFLSFSGACTGSTSGGMKAMRFLVLLKMTRMQIRRALFPHGAIIEKYENKPLSIDVMNSVGVFFFVFLCGIVILTLLLQLAGLDFETSISGALTAIANVGPGIGDTIGPSGNFATLPDSAKWLLAVGMLLGRLEFFTVLVLFTPAYWR